MSGIKKIARHLHSVTSHEDTHDCVLNVFICVIPFIVGIDTVADLEKGNFLTDVNNINADNLAVSLSYGALSGIVSALLIYGIYKAIVFCLKRLS